MFSFAAAEPAEPAPPELKAKPCQVKQAQTLKELDIGLSEALNGPDPPDLDVACQLIQMARLLIQQVYDLEQRYIVMEFGRWVPANTAELPPSLVIETDGQRNSFGSVWESDTDTLVEITVTDMNKEPDKGQDKGSDKDRDLDQDQDQAKSLGPILHEACLPLRIRKPMDPKTYQVEQLTRYIATLEAERTWLQGQLV